MTDLIGRLIAWLSLLLTQRDPHPAPTSHPAPTTPPPAPTTPLPAHRSPYGLDDNALLDGAATRPVRPYLIAYEQRQRRREWAVAALVPDTSGPYWIHGLEAA